MVRPLGVGVLVCCVAALAAAFGEGGWAGLRRFADQAAPSRTPAALVAPLCAVAASAVLGWLCLAAVLSALTRLPGPAGRHATVGAQRIAPAVLRTGVVAALGGSLALAAAPTTVAARPHPAAAAGHQGATADPLPQASGNRADGRAAGHIPPAVPTWTPGPPPAPPAVGRADVSLVSSSARPDRAIDKQVVVRRGDSLWAIAARYLPADADDVEIARAWPRWYAANRAVIGDDPALLQPGQLLVRPPDP